MKIRKTLGIDLGTTNSVIALLDPTDSSIITAKDAEGQQTFPSIVAYRPEQNRLLAGRQAQKLAGATQPPVHSAKRYMGVDHQFALGEQKLSPPEVSAQILQHLRDSLAQTLQDSQYVLDHAVITMPAYFNHSQIEDTRQAGELAGLKVVELLHEPTAAAIYYSWVMGHGDATYLVYDLGGGTFDVSIIRSRFGDYEVLGVSGDPFLGGDDFDRLLASRVQEQLVASHPTSINFDLGTPEGLANFTALTRLAEFTKMELTDSESTTCQYPHRRPSAAIVDAVGQVVEFSIEVNRQTFHRLIKEKIDRSIESCQEALSRAKDKAGLELSEIDHVILVGGSTRVPLVRETIRAAFCNPSLPSHVKNPEPLLDNPDLCVGYGAALRAATHGTRYLISVARSEESLLPDLDLDLGNDSEDANLELHLTSSMSTRNTQYTLNGCIRGAGAMEVTHGGSLQVKVFSSGLTEEVFFDAGGGFSLDLDLQSESDNALELIVLDNLGQELAQLPACVRHRAEGPGSPGLGVLPTQLITKPLAIEVLDRNKKRVKQILAPLGAALPGTFRCTCRTVDQAGRIVVPIFEENRVIKEMLIDQLDQSLPIGTPVEVEFNIDVKHNIEVSVRVTQANRQERAVLSGPPSPTCPTKLDVSILEEEIVEELQYYSGSYRTRMRARMEQIIKSLHEAMFYEDEPQAIQRMSELRALRQQLEEDKERQVLDPPWPKFTQLIHDALDLAEEVAQQSERNLQPLVEPIHAHRYHAEKAAKEKDQRLYSECWHSLSRYYSSLEDLLQASLPSEDESEFRDPELEAREELERFRHYLSALWKQVQMHGRRELEEQLQRVANRSQGLSSKLRDDPHSVLRDTRSLSNDLRKIEEKLRERPKDENDNDAGLLSMNDQ